MGDGFSPTINVRRMMPTAQTWNPVPVLSIVGGSPHVREQYGGISPEQLFLPTGSRGSLHGGAQSCGHRAPFRPSADQLAFSFRRLCACFQDVPGPSRRFIPFCWSNIFAISYCESCGRTHVNKLQGRTPDKKVSRNSLLFDGIGIHELTLNYSTLSFCGLIRGLHSDKGRLLYPGA